MTYTPVLASDGADLAASIATILPIGDGEALRAAVRIAWIERHRERRPLRREAKE